MEHGKEALINHLMACRRCYAPNNRYCEEGLRLTIESTALFIADQPTKEQRRGWIDAFAEVNPQHVERLKARVVELYNGRDLANSTG